MQASPVDSQPPRRPSSPQPAALRGAYRQDIVVAAMVVGAIALMLVPMPRWVVDLLLTANLALGLLMLSSSVLLTDPLRLTSFPTLLILATLGRLAANVSTTRLILGSADGGAVVKAFGAIAMADSVTVGIVVFLLIMVTQFLVIARGAERIAEVTARFVLDALPGKQQAIEADVRAGAIDRHEAARRRARLATESQFFGSMEGAMKFIKGDAIATMIVVLINLIGGLAIGLGQRGMSVGDAVATYSMLSIGEGLAAQVPALLAAAAAGILVARRARGASDGAAQGALGHDIFSQLGAVPAALVVTGVLLALIAMAPGMPLAPFALLAAVCLLAVYGYLLGRPRRTTMARQELLWNGVSGDDDAREPGATEAMYLVLGDAVAAEFAGPKFEANLQAVAQKRLAIAERLGCALPSMVVIAPSQSAPHGIPAVASRELCLVWQGVPRAWHAMTSPNAWLATAEHLILEAAPAFVTVEAVRDMCHQFANTPSRAAQLGEVVPRVVSYAQLTNVLRELVRDQVAIGDLATILRALATAPAGETDTALLVERVRVAACDAITHAISSGRHAMVWHLDPLAEDAIREAITLRGANAHLALAPDLARDIVEATKRCIASDSAPHAILVASDIRRHLRTLLYPELPMVAVVAHSELRPGAVVVPRGQITV